MTRPTSDELPKHLKEYFDNSISALKAEIAKIGTEYDSNYYDNYTEGRGYNYYDSESSKKRGELATLLYTTQSLAHKISHNNSDLEKQLDDIDDESIETIFLASFRDHKFKIAEILYQHLQKRHPDEYKVLDSFTQENYEEYRNKKYQLYAKKFTFRGELKPQREQFLNIFADIAKLLVNRELCTKLLGPIDQKIREEGEKYGINFDEKPQYTTKVFDQKEYPVPPEDFVKTTKTFGMVRRIFSDVLKEFGIEAGDEYLAFADYIEPKIFKQKVGSGQLFTEYFLNEVSMSHGRMSHIIQICLIALAIKNEHIKLPEGINLRDVINAMIECKSTELQVAWNFIIDHYMDLNEDTENPTIEDQMDYQSLLSPFTVNRFTLSNEALPALRHLSLVSFFNNFTKLRDYFVECFPDSERPSCELLLAAQVFTRATFEDANLGFTKEQILKYVEKHSTKEPVDGGGKYLDGVVTTTRNYRKLQPTQEKQLPPN